MSKKNDDYLKFMCGGYFEGYKNVHYKDGKVSHFKGLNDLFIRDDGEPISKKKWKKLVEKLTKLGIWHWKSRYDQNNVMDGCQWELEISYKGKIKKIYGSNSYPDDNYFASLELTPLFNKLCKTIGKFIGKPKYFFN